MPDPKKAVFESKLLPDGHLFCPKEFADKKNLHFKVIVTETAETSEASPAEIEYANLQDVSAGFLSEAELSYYYNLKPLPIPLDNIYHAILKGNQLQWTEERPSLNQEQEVSVLIKPANEINPSLRQHTSNGEQMAQCLNKIANSGGVASIAEPSEWQREIRKDRDIYSGYEK